jgi:SH3 domain-containing YSC84-like protein 1
MMMRTLLFIGLFFISISAQAKDGAELVRNAELTARGFLAGEYGLDVKNLWRKSKAVVIIPNFYRAGFVLGGAGGSGVLIMKTPDGLLSQPAFVGLGMGGVGFQIGANVSEIMLFIMTNAGLEAVINNSANLGGQAGLSIATFGGGVSGALNLDADFVTMARSVGLYAGLSLEGGSISGDHETAGSYYGRAVSVRDILFSGQVNNPDSQVLIRTLDYYAKGGAPTPIQ